MSSGVRAGVSEGRILGVRVGDQGVAVGTRADVVARVGHVAGVRVGDDAGTARIAREDPVPGSRGAGACVEGARGGEIRAAEGSEIHVATAVTTVEPDLVPAAAPAVEEVAHGEVLDRDAVGLEELDAVAPGRA